MPVSGEEKGLLGSRYYSDHPVFPLEQTVALDALDPHHVSALLCAADAAAFYTRQKPCSGQIGLDAQPHGTCGYAMVAERAC